MKKSALASIVALAIIGSCTKEEVTPRSYPRVNTLEVSNITSGGALLSAEIVYSSVQIVDHGFLWSDRSDALFSNSDKISLGPANGPGKFQANCERSLAAQKTYYVRGYAISEDHSVYGDIVTFVSLGSKAPVMKDFSPTLASWDDTVTVTGENFSTVPYNNIVKFDNIEASVLKATESTLEVKVPYQLAEEFSSISVSLSGNVSKLEKKFQLRAPILSSISPSSGTSGSNVTIAGQYIKSQNTKIYFNNVPATIVQWGTNSVQCKAPAGLPAGILEVRVVTGLGNLSDTLPFEIQGPKLIQVVPALAGEGDEIKLLGDYFSDDPLLNEVKFDNAVATVVSASRTELRVIVPPHVNAINPTISVSISGAQANSNAFSFPAPEILSFTPTSGVRGTQLTINGKYFRTGGYNRVFIGDHELSYVNGVSPTQLTGGIYFSPANHTEKIKVTFQNQEAYSTVDLKMPWIQLNGYPEEYSIPGASLTYNNVAYTGFSNGVYNKFWKFDPATHGWSQLAAFPGTARQNIVTFTAGSKGYFGGGIFYSTNVTDLWQYDFTTNTWAQKSNLPMTGIARAAFGYSNTGYLLELDLATQNTNLWKYNHNTDSWAIESTAPFALGEEPGQFLIGNTLYLIVNYDLWKYDFMTSQWTNLGPKPSGVNQCFSIGNFGYGIGNQQMFKFDPLSNTWSDEPSSLGYYSQAQEVFSVSGKSFVFTYYELLEFDPSY